MSTVIFINYSSSFNVCVSIEAPTNHNKNATLIELVSAHYIYYTYIVDQKEQQKYDCPMQAMIPCNFTITLQSSVW